MPAPRPGHPTRATASGRVDVEGGGRVKIKGDDIRIGSRAATPLALIFHELATNAAKYGALSDADGHVRIEVAAPEQTGGDYNVHWSEHSDRFTRNVAPEEEGFGSRLLRMAIEGQLRGSFRRTFSDDGLDVEITIPGENLSR